MTDGPVIASDPGRHWDAVYRDRAVDSLSWFQHSPDLALCWIRDLELAPDDPVVDVGAGASFLVDGLLDDGHRDVTVLDVAEAALKVSRQRLGERADGVHWVVGDVLGWVPTRRYGLWHDRAVLHFLTGPQDRHRYARLLADAVADDGYALLGGFAPDGPTHCSGLPVVRRSAGDLAAAAGAGFTTVRTGDEVHRTPSGTDQPFSRALLRRDRRTT